jgi:FtsP/CotA-like multicopper oxidase with cupredoxin domain
MLPFTTMAMQWTPVHAGNWVFHCHITPHIMPHPPLGPMKASSEHAHAGEMAGMVMGIFVRGPVAADPAPQRNIRLIVQQFEQQPGDLVKPFSYSLDHDATEPQRPGPTLFLTRNQPTAITVVNHAQQPTAVHWHGLEIQSFYDGVHDFGGHENHIAPQIAPGDSFVVMIDAPRAGTFMYHTHYNEGPQQRGGLVGALIVLDPGQKWDAQHERLILISNNRRAVAELNINGADQTTLHMTAGETYRLRFMQIHVGAVRLVATVSDGARPLQWRMVARDGFDIPADQRVLQPATVAMGPGQTYDMLFTPPTAGTYQLQLKHLSIEGETIASNSTIVVEAKK